MNMWEPVRDPVGVGSLSLDKGSEDSSAEKTHEPDPLRQMIL